MEITTFFIAVGLAMDAFAVSVSNGVTISDFKWIHGIKQGLYFGGFQFLMPLLGYLLGSSVKESIEAVDHWIAFLLLCGIGLNMVLESRQKDTESKQVVASAHTLLTGRILLVQAVATSIDALAVGISFALLEINILISSAIIGSVAFLFSVAGGLLGKGLGSLFRQKAECMGGIILIGIGMKILAEHFFF